MMPEILIKPISWLLTTKTYRNFARNILSGWTLRTYGYPKLKAACYWQIKEELKKAIAEQDGIFVFCSADTKMVSYKIEHLFTSNEYGHCGFVFIDDAGEVSVKHVNTTGFVVEPLLNVLNRDRFYVGRLPVSDLAEAKRRLTLLEELCNKPEDAFDYDYSIELEPELISLICDPTSVIPSNFKFKMYCSEFIYLVGKDLVAEPNFKLNWFGDRYLFEPDDVYEGTKPILRL
jgi:hypothetical protein